jgi:putative endopeptidase
MKQTALLFLALISLFVACNDQQQTKKPDVLAVNMDTTVSPSSDFFTYANGGWIKKNPIPAAYGSWTIGHLVIEENRNRLREISEKAAKANTAKGSAEQKISDYWATAMDSVKIEQQGIKPLQP